MASLVRALERLVRALYRRADLVVVVTPTALRTNRRAGRRADTAGARAQCARAYPLGANHPRRTHRIHGGLRRQLGLDDRRRRSGRRRGAGRERRISRSRSSAMARKRAQARRTRCARSASQRRVCGSLPRRDAHGDGRRPTLPIIPLRKGLKKACRQNCTMRCRSAVRSSLRPKGKPSGKPRRWERSTRRPAMRPRWPRRFGSLSRLDKDALRELGDHGRALVRRSPDRADIMGDVGTARSPPCAELSCGIAQQRQPSRTRATHTYTGRGRSSSTQATIASSALPAPDVQS